jgi:hypothetical protein
MMNRDTEFEKCSWPGCQDKSFIHTNLQLMELDGKGGLKPADSENGDHLGAPVPFCKYHWMLLDFCIAVRDLNNKDKIMLQTTLRIF